MKTRTLMLGIFAMSLITSPAQIAYGPRLAVAYSKITLAGAETPLETTGSSIGYQAGLFLRKDFSNFYLEGNILYSGNMGGTYVYESNEQEITVSFASLPVMIGKKFFPGIRVFTGVAPALPISVTEFDVHDFIQATSSMSGSGDFMLNFLIGGGLDISKLTLSVQYQTGILGGFYDHETNLESGTVYHRISMVSAGLSISLN